MSDTPRTDALEDRCFEQRTDIDEIFVHARQLERELVEAREQLRLCNVDQFTTAAELAEAQEELNDKRKFCYAVEQALDGMKGDYVEIIKELRKDAERYRWLRDNSYNTPIGVYEWVERDGRLQRAWLADNELDAAIDAAMKEGGK